MGVLVPDKFRRSGNSAIAAYNWTDIVTKTGGIILYGGDTADSGTILSTNTYFSNTGYIDSATSTGASFAITFNGNVNMRGTSFIEIPLYAYNGAVGDSTISTKIAPYLKVNGVEVASGATITVTTGSIGAGTGTFKIPSWSIDVPLTPISSGDVVVLQYLLTSMSVPESCSLYVMDDPKNRDFNLTATDFVSSQLRFQMPVRIDATNS